MTVHELIERLQALDPELEVVTGEDIGYVPVHDALERTVYSSTRRVFLPGGWVVVYEASIDDERRPPVRVVEIA